MKLSLHKKITSPAAMLVAASISCLGLCQQADAGVIWLASDDGSNLTLTTNGGGIDLTGAASINTTALTTGLHNSASSTVYSLNSAFEGAHNIGTVSIPNPWIAGANASTTTVAGHSFGFNGATVYWDPAFGAAPGTIIPVTSVTFPGLTVATAYGSNLDSGPVLLWTHNTTGDTISVGLAAPVPEPSSAALLGLGALGLIRHRRRK